MAQSTPRDLSASPLPAIVPCVLSAHCLPYLSRSAERKPEAAYGARTHYVILDGPRSILTHRSQDGDRGYTRQPRCNADAEQDPRGAQVGVAIIARRWRPLVRQRGLRIPRCGGPPLLHFVRGGSTQVEKEGMTKQFRFDFQGPSLKAA
eukprot:2157077-Rhodomonas_salina.3